ncbi:MAG: hypothetical protein PHD51_00605 [Patescibacteria group bacterium]|nr:hypothetical protein [Patescibacteria group bacterium]MDD5490633.1 hypothetical protein [Patescibacteria group bacterium]
MNEELKKEEKEKPVHPLLKFVPRVWHSFEEWLKRWEQTTYLAEKLGLLHGLLVGEGWPIKDRHQLVLFLLEVADGYNNDSNFYCREEGLYGYGNGEKNSVNRRAIAEKAFDVLCLNFFKGSEKNYGEPLWWWMVSDERLFEKVLWFLAPDRKNCQYLGRLYRLNHSQEIFKKFLQDFSWLGWEYRQFVQKYSDRWLLPPEEETEKRMIATRPQFIEILDTLGELHCLNGQELDPASIKKLTELALGRRCHLPKISVEDNDTYRIPKSLEEAVLGGSVAAVIIVLYRIRQREKRRIDTKLEKSERAYKEQRRREEIVRINNEKKALEERAEELATKG